MTTHHDWWRFRVFSVMIKCYLFSLGCIEWYWPVFPHWAVKVRSEEWSAARHWSSIYLEVHSYTVISSAYIFTKESVLEQIINIKQKRPRTEERGLMLTILWYSQGLPYFLVYRTNTRQWLNRFAKIGDHSGSRYLRSTTRILSRPVVKAFDKSGNYLSWYRNVTKLVLREVGEVR